MKERQNDVFAPGVVIHPFCPVSITSRSFEVLFLVFDLRSFLWFTNSDGGYPDGTGNDVKVERGKLRHDYKY